MSAIDPRIPITMLPVRIETRFAGPPASPRLLVRIYPDDVHIDRHDPRLTSREVDAGKRYWTSVRSATAGDQAWAQLVKDVGPTRAIWTRQALTPTNPSGAPAFPDAATVDGNAGIAPVARALPASFVVRVRHPGGETIVEGGAIPASLQVGIGLGTVAPGTPVSPTASVDATRVLDEGMRWMVDFQVAVDVGMAVEVDLPPHTDVVQDVVVVGSPIAGANGAATIVGLVEAHRLSDGAAFIVPGTPTNNLADSASGYSMTAAPRVPPELAPADGSVAAALATAWGVDPLAFASIDGCASRELEEARQMSRALFEATWGSYLRQHTQPAVDLSVLPEVYAHVTSFVRGGGPLPAIRLGRQPYAVAPIMARGTWSPLTEGAFARWLSEFLPRIRPLWTAGIVDAPAGPDLLAHEPVSTRVRLRTTHMRAVVDYLVALGGAVVGGNLEVTPRAMLAEVGFTAAMPSVFTNLYARSVANLWLPMAADGDTAFDLLAPAPKDATSVLGLLLRNSAIRIAANVTHELTGLAGGRPLVEIARTSPALHIANLPAAAGRATSVSAFTAEAGDPTDGATRTIRDHLAEIVSGPTAFAFDLTRYFNSDALAAFRDAVGAIAAISTDRRATLAGEIIDCASHRYDPWVTSLAVARLAAMRATTSGNQIGAWGAVGSIRRRAGTPVMVSDTIPAGTVTDPSGGGFVLAPSPRHASTAGVLRAAWRAHGGSGDGALAPFATGMTSKAVRRALTLADGMRNGQSLGALLGYLLERGIHDASGVGGIEIDRLVFELRRRFPLQVDTIDNAPQASAERTVADGWKLAQVETSVPGAVVAALPATGAEKAALQVVIDDVVAVLDALADLGLAESMYQLAGANLERAAAAADMLGRASAPPDRFEVTMTPRGGRGIEQRLIVTFGGGARPAGYATDTPRARLAPAADAFVARRLGSLDGIRVRLLGSNGAQLAAPLLASLELSALDLAALDLSSENVTLSNVSAPTTMPGAPNPNPGRKGVARLLLAAAHPDAHTVGFDLAQDGELLDVLDHAAAWHHTLAGRRPLTAETFVGRAQVDTAADTSAVGARVASLAQELRGATPAAWKAWGIDDADPGARAAIDARLAAASVTDPVEAAAQLLGSPAVVEGSLAALPPDIRSAVDDQASVLGARTGVLARWIQDSARVRPAAATLGDALLRDELADRALARTWAAQSPAAPYVDIVDAALAHSWVGLPFPAAVADAPVTSVVIVGDDASGAVTGIELDAWTEVVPHPTGTAAVTANLTAPDARAPNLILVAVPPDTSVAWTHETLLSVVDEALELAACRMVDLDATRRVPAVLPAIYLEEFDENDLDLRHFLSVANQFPARWVAKEQA